MRPCIFLDRDGTLIHEVSYLSNFDQIQFYGDVPHSLFRLQQASYLLIVVTNQSGVARGYFDTKFVEETFSRLNEILLKDNVQLNDHYYCPHHPLEGIIPYRTICNCRKPEPGMIIEACRKNDIDLSRSFMLGDKLCDIQLAKKAGVKGILITTGHGNDEVNKVKKEMPDTPIFDNFSKATDYILSYSSRSQ